MARSYVRACVCPCAFKCIGFWGERRRKEVYLGQGLQASSSVLILASLCAADIKDQFPALGFLCMCERECHKITNHMQF